jgi:hypothetical protein
MFPRQQENTAIMEETFSAQSMLRCYKQDQLPVAVRKVSEELVRHLDLTGFSDLNEKFVGQSGFYRLHFMQCVHSQL